MRREPRVVLLLVLLCTAALAAGDPTRTDLARRLAPPSAAHWLGQDGLGRDVLARITAGAGVSFGVAVSVVTISLVVGVAVGATAGLAGGWTDLVIARAIDVV